MTNWKAAERIYRSAQKKSEGAHDWPRRWSAVAQMRDLMPVFPYEQDVDTYWLNVMDAAASRNGLMSAASGQQRD